MTGRFGFFAALGALVASVGYGVPQLLQVAGVLTFPSDLILIFAPSLALAPLFVLTMVAVHVAAPAEKRVWSLAALALAIMYAVLVSMVYVVQLGVVIPLRLEGQAERVALFECCAQFQPMTAIDLLGYTLMSLSTGFAAAVFGGSGVGRAARLWLLANALLAPFLILQVAWPSLIYVGALWLVTFPLSMLFVTLVFRRDPVIGEAVAIGAFAARIEVERR
jgi:hypothetical protein